MKGFTLVELLAVIVILAVIALITIPAVLKMIDNSTTNSYRRSIDLYGKAVSQGVISYESDMVEKNKPINITFENIDSYIEYEGNDVDCKDKTIYSDRTILLTECTVQDELVYAEKGRGYGEDNYYYYTNSKKKLKLIKYIEAVEEAIQDKNISGTCTIGEDKITCNGQDITITSKLENAIEGNLTIKNDRIKSYSNLKFKNSNSSEKFTAILQYENYTKLLSDSDNDGKVSVGDKYSYKVNDNNTFNFYVLSIEGSKVNLLMDKNICEDGTTNYTEENNYCLCAWHEGANDSTYGPDTAMRKLYNATKDWINVPVTNMIYEDEGNRYAKENNMENIYGYGTIETTSIGVKITKVDGTEITGSNNQNPAILYENGKPLRAHLPMESEIITSETKCTGTYASCEPWLVENLWDDSSWCSECHDKYISTQKIPYIGGYWLMSSYLGIFKTAANYIKSSGNTNSYGSTNYLYAGDSNTLGVRPVITVPMSYLTD